MKVNEQNNRIQWAEPIIVACIWLLVLSSPLMFFREFDYVQWDKVLNAWALLVPFFVLFTINHFVLVPFLLFRNRKIAYILGAIILVGLVSLNSLFKVQKEPLPDRAPPHLRGQDRPPPMDDIRERDFPDDERRPREPPPEPRPERFPPFLNMLLISVLVIGFDTGLRVSVKWYQLGKEKAEVEKESVKNELAFLRNQISPHFFMNTLNNIHALVDVDSEQAKDAIIRLSKLMRQLLYESESDRVPLAKELDFIQSYINLMSLRFSDKVKVTIQIPDELPDKSVPPSLFISLIENAFKHGVSYSKASFIDVAFVIKNELLEFTVRNSKHKQVQIEEYSGIGIENTRKRLNLLYGNNYELAVLEEDELFLVNLNIPI